MSEENPVTDTPEQRRTLWIVLALNVALTLGFAATGLAGDSSALIANALDNASDSLVYVISLLALTRSEAWKHGAARLSGGLLLLFAAGVLLDAVRRYLTGSEPLGPAMIAMALVGGVVNAICVRLLNRVRQADVNMRAAQTFSFNDFVANAGWPIWQRALAGQITPTIAQYYNTVSWEITDAYGPRWVTYRVTGRSDFWWLELSPALGRNTSLPLRFETSYTVNVIGIAYRQTLWTLGLVHRF